MNDYLTRHTLDERMNESSRVLTRYGDRVPVIVQRQEGNDKLPDLDKHKYLVPSDMTIGEFVYIIRKRIRLSQDQAIFIFVNNVLPPTSACISQVYNDHKNEDGFMYIVYSGENTFGSSSSSLSSVI